MSFVFTLSRPIGRVGRYYVRLQDRFRLAIFCVGELFWDAFTPGNVGSGHTVLGGYFPGKVPAVIVRRVRPGAVFPETVPRPGGAVRVGFAEGRGIPFPCAASFPGNRGTGSTGLGRYGPAKVPAVIARRVRPTVVRTEPPVVPPREGRDVFPGGFVWSAPLLLRGCNDLGACVPLVFRVGSILVGFGRP